MKRAYIIVPVAVAAIVAGILFFRRSEQAGSPGSGAPARDVILVTIDTLRADALAHQGNANVRTPFLDSLAARGRVFANAHAHNVVTLPSHVNILTGRHPFEHGVRENAGFKLDAAQTSVAETLKSAGYATGAFVGAFPLDARFGLNQGFDLYDDNYGKGQASVDFVVQERRASDVLSAATKWWSSNSGRPRFMWVHVYDPHAPYAAPEPFLSEYRQNPYLGEVAYVDQMLSDSLGPLLTANPDALVIVTADHGEALGDHGEKSHGLFAYEATLKVPLIVAGPRVKTARVSEYVRHIDIVPTILDATGVKGPPDLPGSSLLAEKIESRDTYFEALTASLNRGWAPLTGVIHGSLKYIDLPVPELYDLPADPAETNNLRESRRREVEAARRILDPMKRPAEKRAAVSAEELARLRSLGYVAGTAPQKTSYTAADDPKNLVGLDAKIHDSIAAFHSNDLPRALQLARELVAERGDMTAGRELLSFMLQQSDRAGDAIEQLRIICGRPDATDANFVQLALLLSETGKPAEAADILAGRAPNGDPDVLNAYGIALADSGKADIAAQQFERALAIDRNNAPAIQNLGILALKRGDRTGAEANLTRALELNPRLPLALNTLGVIYAQNGDFDRAVTAWKRAVDVDSRQYDALLNIGIVAGRAGRPEESRAALERFVATAPRSRYAADIATARRALASMAR